MSISTEITRLENAKAAIKTTIEGKGVTVPDTTLLDGMAALIDSIQSGGGLPSEISQIEYGTFTPTEDKTSAASDGAYASFDYDIGVMRTTDEDIYTDVSGDLGHSVFLTGIRVNLPYAVGSYKSGNSVQYRTSTGTSVFTENQALTNKAKSVIPYSQKYLIAGHTYEWVAIKFA